MPLREASPRLSPGALLGARPIVWIVIGVALVAACCGLFFDRTPLDFRVYLAAGHAANDGIALYGPDVRVHEYGLTYPPFAALLFAALADLPFGLALAVLTIASVAGLLAAVALSAPDLLRRLTAPNYGWALAGVAALLVCEPVRSTLWDGQIDLVLLGLVVVDLLALRHRPYCGVLVGLATAVKLTPAIFVLYLLLRKEFASAARAVAAFAVTVTIGWLVLPSDSSQFWFHKLYSSSGIGDESRSSNYLGFLQRTFTDHTAVRIWAPIAVLTAVVGLVAAAWVARSGRESYALGIVGVTGCLISPVTWTHHWVWCIPWLAGVGRTALANGRLARIGFGLLVFVYLALNLVPSRISTDRVPITKFLQANVLALSALLVALVAGIASFRGRAVPAQGGVARVPSTNSGR